MRHVQGKGGRRMGHKKRPNRYNPNKPDWRAVHLPGFLAGVALGAAQLFKAG